jgi:toxin FitB
MSTGISILKTWFRLAAKGRGTAQSLLQSFGDGILPVNEEVAQNWGRLNAGRLFPVIDSLLAATAEAHGLTLITRNVKDIERSGARCMKPFEFRKPRA